MKQETLEEAVNKYTEFLPNLPYKLAVKQAFKEGAKWQAKRMYSEEDLQEAFYSHNQSWIDSEFLFKKSKFMEKKIKLKDYSLISNEELKFILGNNYEVYVKQGTIIPSIRLASAAYDAGTIDEELSQTFDNPKGRFINSEIEL
jgi:hypothetical protein